MRFFNSKNNKIMVIIFYIDKTFSPFYRLPEAKEFEGTVI